MGFFSDLDIEIREMIADGATREEVSERYPDISEDVIETYFNNDHDGDADDGQPDEYTEWQDYMGGDDWDHGQYDTEY